MCSCYKYFLIRVARVFFFYLKKKKVLTPLVIYSIVNMSNLKRIIESRLVCKAVNALFFFEENNGKL
jgi:hypothetical protein